MSAAVNCPKCHSDQVSAQKRGFSVGKAAAGVVLTGGVGAVAGLHGANKVEVHCMKCGHSWNPAQQAKKEIQQKETAQHRAFENRKKRFYAAYEAGDMEMAEKRVPDEKRYTLKHFGIDQVYKELKTSDRNTQLFLIVSIGLVLGLLIWLFN